MRVKERIQKPPLRSQGPWPDGKQKWLKTPTLLATGPGGELFLYQDDLGQAFLLKDGQLIPAGPPARAAKALVATPAGQVWLVTARQGVVREGAPAIAGVPPLQAPTGAALDPWGNLWLSDAKAPSLQVVPPEGPARTVPLAGGTGLAALPGSGWWPLGRRPRPRVPGPPGQVRFTVPYGKDLPAPFKSVLALAADPLGHVAALVEGDFEGVAVWGPDGALLRSATFKSLGLAGKYRAIAMDRQGGLILADRSNDQLIRLD